MTQKQLGLDPANTVDTATKAYVDAALVNGHHLATIGDGAETSFEITHNLGFDDVLVQLREVSSGDIVRTDITIDDENTITLTFQDPPDTNSLRVLVVAPGITSISSAAVTAITDYLTESNLTWEDAGGGEWQLAVGGSPVGDTTTAPATAWSAVASRPHMLTSAETSAGLDNDDIDDRWPVGHVYRYVTNTTPGTTDVTTQWQTFLDLGGTYDLDARVDDVFRMTGQLTVKADTHLTMGPQTVILRDWAGTSGSRHTNAQFKNENAPDNTGPASGSWWRRLCLWPG